jgi:transcriptional regulator with XRE-family HTH domain
VADTDEVFSARLREVRAATGKSLKELERLTATSDSSLSRYLSGAICPPWSVVEMLCTAAGRDPATLRQAWEQANRQRSAARVPAPPVPAGTGGAPRRRGIVRRLLLASAAALVVASTAGLALWHSWPTTSAHRACPWQYVVTDGDPSPVIVFDQPGPDGHRTGQYQPSQIFYAPDPVQAAGRRMRTTDGWVNKGDWIRRYPGTCRG